MPTRQESATDIILSSSTSGPLKQGILLPLSWLLKLLGIFPSCQMHVVRSLVLCKQGFSLLWTTALRPFESVQCASPGRGGELIGVCGVSAV